MEQLDLFRDTPEKFPHDSEPLVSFSPPVYTTKEELREKTNAIINRAFPFSFENSGHKSYKIETQNDHISKVYFSFAGEKYLAYIEYQYENRIKKYINYTEPDPEDREVIIHDFRIFHFKITAIQKKVKVGYGGLKYKSYSFRSIGIDCRLIVTFLEGLIEKYHTNN